MAEPTLIRAGDGRVLLNGLPPRVDCRVVAEERYQQLLEMANLGLKEEELKPCPIKILQEIARLANRVIGNSCCAKHYAENIRQLNKRLALFVDDSFEQLKAPITRPAETEPTNPSEGE